MAGSERVNPTEVRSARSVKSWDLEADVVVVGYGCAGACTAIEAAEAGADVLVLEVAGGGGGTSALSGGILYLGGGTPVQKACGFEDTPEDMFRFLMASCGPEPDEAKVRVYSEESVEHFHWLVAHGVPFKESFYPEPGMEPPGDDCLIYTGGEDSHPFNRIVRPAPRGHKPRTNGAAGGFLMQRLTAATERSGARIECNARCETLVLEDDGRVAGVVVWQDQRERFVRARRGVVLTAGGFILNPDMVYRHSPRLARIPNKLSAGHDDGRAIRMAMGAGADVMRMDAAEIAIPVTPPRRLMRGILVNLLGQRFVNEDTYFGRLGQESFFRQDGQAYLITDNEIYERNLIGMEASHVDDSIADLERSLGMPDGSLQSTVELYNRHAARAEDPVLHKLPEFLKPLNSPPYAAIDCRLDHAIYCSFTLGGLRTRVTGEVLTPDLQEIPGLYAAGRTTSGIASWGYCSGLSLGDGTFFGRRAGRRAATAR